MAEAKVGYRQSDILGAPLRRVTPGCGQDERELLAPVTAGDVAAANLSA